MPPDWDQALELTAEKSRIGTRVGRAVALARAGEGAKALSEAEDLAAAPSITGAMAYDLACVFALCMEPTSQTRSGNAADTLGRKAVVLLELAAKKGFNNPMKFSSDPFLAAVRTRADFQALLQRLKELSEKKT